MGYCSYSEERLSISHSSVFTFSGEVSSVDKGDATGAVSASPEKERAGWTSSESEGVSTMAHLFEEAGASFFCRVEGGRVHWPDRAA